RLLCGRVCWCVRWRCSLEGGGYAVDLRSFPTRRSSDLARDIWGFPLVEVLEILGNHFERKVVIPLQGQHQSDAFNVLRRKLAIRSEEHTSELQSRFDLVCRLLLEKKNEMISTYAVVM